MTDIKEAKVFGKQLNISRKHASAICNAIKGKSIEEALSLMESVVLFKKPIGFRGREIPHKKGMESGRYPIKACREFVRMLKNLSSNASVKGIGADTLKIRMCKADKAVDKRGGRFLRFKRANVLIIAEGNAAEKIKERQAGKEKKAEQKEEAAKTEIKKSEGEQK